MKTKTQQRIEDDPRIEELYHESGNGWFAVLTPGFVSEMTEVHELIENTLTELDQHRRSIVECDCEGCLALIAQASNMGRRILSDLDNILSEEYKLAETQNTSILLGDAWYSPAEFTLEQLQQKVCKLRATGKAVSICGIKKFDDGGTIVKCRTR